MISKPRRRTGLGMSLGDTRLLPRWVRHIGSMSPILALVRNVRRRAPIRPPAGRPEARGRTPSGGNREERSTDAGTLADSSVVAVILLRIAVGWGAKGRGRPGERVRSTGREESHGVG